MATLLDIRRTPITLGHRVAVVGTHPPTQCGVATFTENVRRCIDDPDAGWRADVVRVVDDDYHALGPGVAVNWNSRDPRSLRQTLDVLAGYDIVVLQHEFGLFSGPDGESVLDLVAGIDVPLVTLVHTAVTDPSPNQHRIMNQLADRSDSLVVLSESARERLVCVNRIPARHISVIPHGAVANVSGVAPRLSYRPTILTWGLLGPGKGIEHVIRAVARLMADGVDVTYVVAGTTHPKVHAREGDRYRNSLIDLADALGVLDRVVFDDRYKDWKSLRAMIRGVDVVVLPYDSHDQVTSGVLVDAMASAKRIVATRFPHAVEMLADGAGLIVDHADDTAMASALEAALFSPQVAASLTRRSFDGARPLLWPVVGNRYRDLLACVVEARSPHDVIA